MSALQVDEGDPAKAVHTAMREVDAEPCALCGGERVVYQGIDAEYVPCPDCPDSLSQPKAPSLSCGKATHERALRRRARLRRLPPL